MHDLHLMNYSVMNCEPLHNVKGHLSHLLEELPWLLPSGQREKCNDLLKAKLGAKVSRADMCAAVIQAANCGTGQSMGASTSPFSHQSITNFIL